jgi:hypothetical protein
MMSSGSSSGAAGGAGSEDDRDDSNKTNNTPPDFLLRKRRGGMNNCLFDSVIHTFSRNNLPLPTQESQALREMCDDILKAEGMPLIPHGEPAGEQYIQALSKILNVSIKIFKDHPNNYMTSVKHSDVADDAVCVSIVHLGTREHGHWVGL